MSTKSASQISSERLLEASEWLVRLREEGASPQETTAWLEWCAAHPDNLEAFDRVQGLLEGLRSLPDASREPFLRSAADREHQNRPQKWVIGFALVAALAALAFIASPWFATLASHPRVFATEHGIQREVTLTDRSRITLGAASTVSARYSEHARRLVLRDGEAFFEVQPNHARPFIVEAGPLVVTAVGTKFDIRRTRQRVIVTVTQGIVDVAAEGSSVPVRVEAGQRAIQNVDTDRLTVVSTDPREALDWRIGRLEYVNEPLASVIEDVNRYAAKPITADPRAIRGLVYSGTVFTDRANEWARALGTVFPLNAQTREDGGVSLTQRSPSKP